jgi:hypothetical protein
MCVSLDLVDSQLLVLLNQNDIVLLAVVLLCSPFFRLLFLKALALLAEPCPTVIAVPLLVNRGQFDVVFIERGGLIKSDCGYFGNCMIVRLFY